MSDMSRPIHLLDGGWVGTLPGMHCDPAPIQDDPVLNQPAAVQERHRAFAAAGATFVLTATLRALPHSHPQWEAAIDSAVALARTAVNAARSPVGTAEVWGVIGPIRVGDVAWIDMPFEQRQQISGSWLGAVARHVAAGVDGIAVMSFTNVLECAAAIREVRKVTPDTPIAGSLMPRDDGRLFDDIDPAEGLIALRRAGAKWVGFNCGGGPGAVESALAYAPDADWVKPSAGTATPQELREALWRLSRKCRFVGGCCGVAPESIVELRHSSADPFRAQSSTAAVGRTRLGSS